LEGVEFVTLGLDELGSSCDVVGFGGAVCRDRLIQS
jgi:hypothetical protein